MCDYMIDCIPFIKEYQVEAASTQVQSSTIFNVKITKGLQRREIFENYLCDVEGQPREPQRSTMRVRCPKCESSNLFTNHVMSENVCGDCGMATYVMSEELTYKEEQETSEKVINYSYKRDNHFNEWLSQFQAQETTTIPPEVVQQLRTEFKKLRIKNVSEITHAKVRTLLKKLRLNKYYEHVPYIANILNGMQPPKMSQALEDRLRMMFRDIQEPFNDHCPESRKNFLSYSYVLYKFCELLGEDDFLPCFPLLKSKEKLYQQDVIWKKICHELKWEFISTV
jgi:ribosomal protein S27AE